MQFNHLLFAKKIKKEITRSNLLIVRLGAIGDVIRTLPSVALLKTNYPKARITYLVEEFSLDIVRNSPIIDEIIVVPRKRWAKYAKSITCLPLILKESKDIISCLHKKRFLISFDMHGIFKSGVLSYLSGAKYRVGFAKKFSREFNHLFSSIHITPSSSSKTRIEQNIDIVRPFINSFISIQKESDLVDLMLDPDESLAIAPFLSIIKSNKEKGRLVVGINPFASKRGGYKTWPIHMYVYLGLKMAKELNAFVYVTYGPSEIKHAKELARIGGGHILLAPKTTLKALGYIIKQSDLFVTGDTGPMHLAGILGTKVAAIFGPSDPVLNYPPGKGHIIIYEKVPCSPCRNRKCMIRLCLNSINSEHVFKRIKPHLNTIKEIKVRQFEIEPS